jgi:chromosomal replication initiation ATPase DnaA
MINQYSSNYPAQKFASFNNFIAIDSNQAAKSTAIQFAQEATSYNVLSISSSFGNGATHLALAILNEIDKMNKTKEIFYSSFERLVMNNPYSNEMTIFNSEFLNTKSLILIDSFYETSNKTFSNKFFDVLKDVKVKIIFTYNKEIKIPIVTKEIYLTYPSKIEKEVIINNILKRENSNLSLEIINYISDQIHLSVREIEGLIISIFAKEILGNFNADIELVKNIHHIMVKSY